MTRAEDVVTAVGLGAAYLGVIFAGGPRAIDPDAAATILALAVPETRRVGVFGKGKAASISATSHAAGLDIIQLHADPTPEKVAEVGALSRRPVWAVVRVRRGQLPDVYADLIQVADAIVLDAAVPGTLGGSGIAFDWYAIARALDRSARPARLVLAGGLTADNVAQAIRALQPDVVDVSTGVELSPGVKHPEKMSAFAAAVRDISP